MHFHAQCVTLLKKRKKKLFLLNLFQKKEKHEHKTLTSEDSLKLANHQIEVKGDVEFPLQLTVDSLKKMKVVTIENLKITGKGGAIKEKLKHVKAYF